MWLFHKFIPTVVNELPVRLIIQTSSDLFCDDESQVSLWMAETSLFPPCVHNCYGSDASVEALDHNCRSMHLSGDCHPLLRRHLSSHALYLSRRILSFSNISYPTNSKNKTEPALDLKSCQISVTNLMHNNISFCFTKKHWILMIASFRRRLLRTSHNAFVNLKKHCRQIQAFSIWTARCFARRTISLSRRSLLFCSINMAYLKSSFCW